MNIKRSVGIFIVLSLVVATIPIAAATEGMKTMTHPAGGMKQHILTEEELAALENMTEEERQIYVLDQVKEQLDFQVAAGALTQEQADEIYAHCASGEFRKTDNGLYGMKGKNSLMKNPSKSIPMLSEDEISAFENMTDHEKKEFMLSKMKDRLDADVAEGVLTREQADEIYEQMSSMDISFGPEGKSMTMDVKAGIQMPGPTVSKEELAAFESMTTDEKQAFLLAQLKEHLESDVKIGRLTQEEADEIYAHSESGGFKIGFLMPPMEPVEN
ncbi:hypothetical protein [Methanolapillus millepedarum]|uniref:DUF2680 domain-containing protein n=1 Tax=Methanolapillus millepedarum TaxID=3028296 RepID=A0AA96V454_9EURY|nr:hypothetical protein MsAc7_11520 [Methanosarcinaceae archaeon Ac7]